MICDEMRDNCEPSDFGETNAKNDDGCDANSTNDDTTGESSENSSCSQIEEQVFSNGVVELPPPPDGGWGWVITFSSFMCNLILDGIAYSFGVFLQPLVNAFDSTNLTVAWVGSLLAGVYLTSGPIVGGLCNKYGCRPVCIAGSIVSCLGFALSTLSVNVPMLMLTYGVIGGFGLGLIYLPAVVAVGYYFEGRRALATGISVCGSGVGTFIFPPLVTKLLEEYGWRGANLILAAICLNCAVFGALMRPLELVSASSHSKNSDDKKSSRVKMVLVEKKEDIFDDSSNSLLNEEVFEDLVDGEANVGRFSSKGPNSTSSQTSLNVPKKSRKDKNPNLEKEKKVINRLTRDHRKGQSSSPVINSINPVKTTSPPTQQQHYTVKLPDGGTVVTLDSTSRDTTSSRDNTNIFEEAVKSNSAGEDESSLHSLDGSFSGSLTGSGGGASLISPHNSAYIHQMMVSCQLPTIVEQSLTRPQQEHEEEENRRKLALSNVFDITSSDCNNTPMKDHDNMEDSAQTIDSSSYNKTFKVRPVEHCNAHKHQYDFSSCSMDGNPHGRVKKNNSNEEKQRHSSKQDHHKKRFVISTSNLSLCQLQPALSASFSNIFSGRSKAEVDKPEVVEEGRELSDRERGPGDRDKVIGINNETISIQHNGHSNARKSVSNRSSATASTRNSMSLNVTPSLDNTNDNNHHHLLIRPLSRKDVFYTGSVMHLVHQEDQYRKSKQMEKKRRRLSMISHTGPKHHQGHRRKRLHTFNTTHEYDQKALGLTEEDVANLNDSTNNHCPSYSMGYTVGVVAKKNDRRGNYHSSNTAARHRIFSSEDNVSTRQTRANGQEQATPLTKMNHDMKKLNNSKNAHHMHLRTTHHSLQLPIMMYSGTHGGSSTAPVQSSAGSAMEPLGKHASKKTTSSSCKNIRRSYANLTESHVVGKKNFKRSSNLSLDRASLSHAPSLLFAMGSTSNALSGGIGDPNRTPSFPEHAKPTIATKQNASPRHSSSPHNVYHDPTSVQHSRSRYDSYNETPPSSSFSTSKTPSITSKVYRPRSAYKTSRSIFSGSLLTFQNSNNSNKSAVMNGRPQRKAVGRRNRRNLSLSLSTSRYSSCRHIDGSGHCPCPDPSRVVRGMGVGESFTSIVSSSVASSLSTETVSNCGDANKQQAMAQTHPTSYQSLLSIQHSLREVDICDVEHFRPQDIGKLIPENDEEEMNEDHDKIINEKTNFIIDKDNGQQPPLEGNEMPKKKDGKRDRLKQSVNVFMKTLSRMVNLHLLYNKYFLLISMANLFGMLGFYVPFVYLPNIALLKGSPEYNNNMLQGDNNVLIDVKSANFLVSVIGISNTIGRVASGWLSDFTWVDSLFVTNIAIFLSGLCVIAIPFCGASYTLYVIIALLFGLFVAAYVSLTSIVLVDLLGLDNLTSAFGFIVLFRGISSMVGAPVAGWVYDSTASYDISFFMAGSFFILAAVIGSVAQILYRMDQKRSNETPTSMNSTLNGDNNGNQLIEGGRDNDQESDDSYQNEIEFCSINGEVEILMNNREEDGHLIQRR